MNSGVNGYQTMPLEKSGIVLPPYPYGLYGAKPKDVQGRTKTKADCKSGKYINIHTVKSRAVDRSTIQFWTLLDKGHST